MVNGFYLFKLILSRKRESEWAEFLKLSTVVEEVDINLTWR